MIELGAGGLTVSSSSVRSEPLRGGAVGVGRLVDDSDSVVCEEEAAASTDRPCDSMLMSSDES